MNTERQQDPTTRELELPDACAACGGVIAAKFTMSGSRGSARGVCLACHMITTLAVSRAEDGVQVGHLPGGFA